MSELLLVNPRKRKTRRKKATRRKATASATVTLRNPRRRSTRRRKAAAAPTRRRARSYRRNPIGGRGLLKPIAPAMQGAIGALALDLLFGYVPVPANLKTGMLRHVTKAAGAIAVGLIGSKLVKGPMAANMAVGAMTVALHDAGKEMLAGTGLKLGEYEDMGFYSPAMIPDASGTALPGTVDAYDVGAYDVSAYDVSEYEDEG